MDAIDVVPLEHIHEYGQAVVGGRWLTGVDPELVAIGLDPFRAGLAQMAAGGWRGRLALTRPKRVEPGVQFQPARMRFGNPQRQRVVKRVGCLTLDAAQVLAPGLEFGGVQGIGTGAHLQNDGVQSQCHRPIQHRAHFCLLGGCTEPLATGPVDIGDSRHPGCAKFARCLGCQHGQILRRAQRDACSWLLHGATAAQGSHRCDAGHRSQREYLASVEKRHGSRPLESSLCATTPRPRNTCH